MQRIVQDLGGSFPGVESTPGVCGGEPCIVRTRIPVWVLEQMRRQIEATLCDYSPEQLRQDKTVRKEAVNSAKSVLDLMAGYVEEAAA